MKQRGNSAKARKWGPVLADIASRLASLYGSPDLGNESDPVREIFYIALSAKTTERLYQRAYRRLWSRFRTVQGIASARRASILDCVKCAGLGNKRASQVKMIAAQLVADFPINPSRELSALPHERVFEYLINLPGVGPKSALCIMMMSLDADVFPVDVNVQRVAERIGIIRAKLKHYQAQKEMPPLVPAGISRQLHVGMVVHGRTICLPQRPKCRQCVLLDLCRYGKQRLEKDRAGPR